VKPFLEKTVEHPPPRLFVDPDDLPDDQPAQDNISAAAAPGPDTVHDKLNDALTPGYRAEFDPAEADRAGAFSEDAISKEDALASTEDLLHFPPS
jgi:hypothetical protein